MIFKSEDTAAQMRRIRRKRMLNICRVCRNENRTYSSILDVDKRRKRPLEIEMIVLLLILIGIGFSIIFKE